MIQCPGRRLRPCRPSQQIPTGRVNRCTSTFKELARNVIVMRFIEEKTYEEIAERLGKNPDYLRSLCSKTIKQIRQKFSYQNDREVSYE